MGYAGLNDRAMELRWYRTAVQLAEAQARTTELIGWYEANFELGRAYAVGDGVERNLDLALLHMGRAEKSPSNVEIRGVPVSKRWMGTIALLRGDRDMAAR